jgi:tryptophan-rich sensory protein
LNAKHGPDLFINLKEIDLTALIKTITLCLLAIIIEAVSATKDGKKWFVELKQPKYSFSLSFWYFIGGLYYLAFGVIGYRIFQTNPDIISLGAVLLILIMLINGFTNFILFKFRSLKIFYLVLYPFALMVIGLILTLSEIDKFSAILAALYLIWLGYDIYYFYTLWKLN